MINGDPKATALTVGEFTGNLLGSTVKLTVKAAFVDPRTGVTHGWTNCESWSPATMEKMREFIEAMETDLARQHFQGFTPRDSGVVEQGKPSGIAEGGLGEHVRGEGEQV